MLMLLLNAAILVGFSSLTTTMKCRSHETSCHGACMARHEQCCSDGTVCQSYEKCCQGNCVTNVEKCGAVTAQPVQGTRQAASQILTPPKPSASEPPFCTRPQPEPDLRTDITQRLSETENTRLQAETDHFRALLTASLQETGNECRSSDPSGAHPLPGEGGGAMAQAVMPPKSSVIEPPFCTLPPPEPDLRTNLTQRLSYLEAENIRLQAVTDHLRASTASLEEKVKDITFTLSVFFLSVFCLIVFCPC